jgi:hypothetical protein
LANINERIQHIKYSTWVCICIFVATQPSNRQQRTESWNHIMMFEMSPSSISNSIIRRCPHFRVSTSNSNLPDRLHIQRSCWVHSKIRVE